MYYRQQADRGSGGVGARHPSLQPAGAGGPGGAPQGLVERAAALRHRLALYGGKPTLKSFTSQLNTLCTFMATDLKSLFRDHDISHVDS